MKVIKIMSIIGIVLFALSLCIIVGFAPDATVADGTSAARAAADGTSTAAVPAAISAAVPRLVKAKRLQMRPTNLLFKLADYSQRLCS